MTKHGKISEDILKQLSGKFLCHGAAHRCVQNRIGLGIIYGGGLYRNVLPGPLALLPLLYSGFAVAAGIRSHERRTPF